MQPRPALQIWMATGACETKTRHGSEKWCEKDATGSPNIPTTRMHIQVIRGTATDCVSACAVCCSAWGAWGAFPWCTPSHRSRAAQGVYSPDTVGICVSRRLSATMTQRPRLKFGIIGDVQYADEEFGTDFMGREYRYFRGTKAAVETAVAAWNAAGVALAFQTGDVIDMRTAETAPAALHDVLTAFRPLACPRVDLVGNHEIDPAVFDGAANVAPRIADWQAQHGGVAPLTGAGPQAYHSWAPAPGWRFVVLNSYEVSAPAFPGYVSPKGSAAQEEAARAGSSNYDQAVEYLRRSARMRDMEATQCRGDFFRDPAAPASAPVAESRLPLDQWRYAPFNGALGAAQRAWLDRELAAAAAARERAMVFTHVPVYVDPAADATDSTTSPRQCQLWDADEVQAVLAKHRHVAAVFTGHYHFGGYARDGHGVHHITLASPLAVNHAAQPEGHKGCFAVVELHDGHFDVVGHGRRGAGGPGARVRDRDGRPMADTDQPDMRLGRTEGTEHEAQPSYMGLPYPEMPVAR